ncbi:uncharacterized protein LOC111093879 isoform X2 [Canis lupus familiaris]|uniref:uncharacterized protein LOC111093879 isoform X2 n=1 Tax=Canis lupus familiaris TaxID=9615 RepID=UPI0018F3B433|nr:uncharacterized protein LOC111093879 isoform X2 [Canis lupus familiaris]
MGVSEGTFWMARRSNNAPKYPLAVTLVVQDRELCLVFLSPRTSSVKWAVAHPRRGCPQTRDRPTLCTDHLQLPALLQDAPATEQDLHRQLQFQPHGPVVQPMPTRPLLSLTHSSPVPMEQPWHVGPLGALNLWAIRGMQDELPPSGDALQRGVLEAHPESASSSGPHTQQTLPRVASEHLQCWLCDQTPQATCSPLCTAAWAPDSSGCRQSRPVLLWLASEILAPWGSRSSQLSHC